MGAFTLIADKYSSQYAELEQKQLQSMKAQGFSAPRRVETEKSVLFVYPKQVSPTVNIVTGKQMDTLAICGTFYYKGTSGEAGLRRILSDFTPPQEGNTPAITEDCLPSRLYGSYALIIWKASALWLFTDRIGFYKVYITGCESVFSSSFLTAVACSSSPSINKQCVYEYVFQGATYGDETVIAGLRSLNPNVALRLDKHTTGYVKRTPLRPPVIEQQPLDFHVEILSAELRKIFAGCVAAFGDSFDTALSGGYDSRLILSYLFSLNVNPSVHVYGKENDSDVMVAKSIAAGEGFPLNHIDKSLGPLNPVDIEQIVDINYHFFDGLPNDGIFDNGTDLATRMQRARGGSLSLNGGGGEIFRNFFYLPDRCYSARDVVWSFYSQYDPATISEIYSAEEYEEALVEKILRALDVPERRLTRGEVERIYPIFRCRYWMGKNTMINNRLGLMHTPLVEPGLVELAGAVPIVHKNFGRLAARLIQTISPKIAAYRSSHGHAFDRRATANVRLAELSTRSRPPRFRKLIFPLKVRLRAKGLATQRSKLNRWVPNHSRHFSRTTSFFSIENVLDPGQLSRLRTLEYFLTKIGH